MRKLVIFVSSPEFEGRKWTRALTTHRASCESIHSTTQQRGLIISVWMKRALTWVMPNDLKCTLTLVNRARYGQAIELSSIRIINEPSWVLLRISSFLPVLVVLVHCLPLQPPPPHHLTAPTTSKPPSIPTTTPQPPPPPHHPASPPPPSSPIVGSGGVEFRESQGLESPQPGGGEGKSSTCLSSSSPALWQCSLERVSL